ncbi:MAG TPA: thrombospondin type 3 repeat-containing protein, partial [Candidatus Eisenbacteria bacterium]|nr:thrombospondin type 3 repeat-containing protein [Candidatus Eisenbacteria bacterium]
MRVRLWFAACGLAALLAAASGSADPAGRYFTLSPFGGYTLFDGSLRFPRTSPVQDGPDVGARLGYQWSPWLGFEAAGGFTPTREDSGGADVKYMHGSANVVVSPAPALWGGPFVFAGIGAARMSTTLPAAQVSSVYSPRDATFNTGNFEWGGGVKLWITDVLAVRLEGRILHWLPKESSGLRLNHVIVGLGLTYALGARPRDTDRDGVPDRDDTCPNTPLGAKVDAHGCPIDSDGDGVFDGLDQCPGTPKGCTVDARGCPIDSDGDGVCDGVDQCPNTPKGAVVDAKGCPVDSDGDGVPDGIDQCPNTPAGLKVDDKGCPIEVIEKETELLDTGMIRLENIHFDTDKWDV